MIYFQTNILHPKICFILFYSYEVLLKNEKQSKYLDKYQITIRKYGNRKKNFKSYIFMNIFGNQIRNVE